MTSKGAWERVRAKGGEEGEGAAMPRRQEEDEEVGEEDKGQRPCHAVSRMPSLSSPRRTSPSLPPSLLLSRLTRLMSLFALTRT